MDINAPRGVLRCFGDMKDPRQNSGKRHPLISMIVIAISAILCGSDGWKDIAEFGRIRKKWFESFLDLPHGIPSACTFGRVFARLDPDAFETCFRQWMQALSQDSGGKLVAVDGKTLRRSFDTAAKKSAIHMVSAWCQSNQTVLGQIVCDDKSNEIPTVPALLELLDIGGAVVTGDAMHCQKKTTQVIIGKSADYVLQVKDNQPQLHEDLQLLFDQGMRKDCHGVPFDYAKVVEKGHGRIDTRECWTTWNTSWITDHANWAGLQSVARVRRTCVTGDKTSVEDRYFISSLSGRDAERILSLARGHWSIENQLHYSLDVTFFEDQRRIRVGHAAENYSRLSRMALNILKTDVQLSVQNDVRQSMIGGPLSKTTSLRARRKIASWDPDYLLHLLTLELKS